jgi:hypothetical protein
MKEPSILYHYTNQEGLLGIIKDRALRATEIQYMNDASELITPISIASDVLTEIGRKRFRELKGDELKFIIDPEKEVAMFIDLFLQLLTEQNTFVISFSRKPDNLSQWRAYGAPSSAYSIGFRYEKLKSVAEKSGFELLKCEYFKEEDLKIVVKEMINELVNESLKKSSGRRADFTWKSAVKFMKIASTMKDYSFKEEEEWRLVLTGHRSGQTESIDFRVGKSMIVPYYLLKLEPFPIYNIHVGPCPHKELAKRAVSKLLHENRIFLTPNNIKISKTPFRNW